MDDKNELEKSVDDIMLPGFRFHPTDEELVGYYLKRKLLHRALPIELIKQVYIYKYDPWDLPKLASSTGEKEWYFYCPRDRKYRNSTRPNRVTGSGFWKATGTDRPIYSSDGAKCIGLKKSLVFYRGRAAKGMKTDWMMHEFRLPSATDGAPPPSPPKKIFDKNFPASDSWAICRIFKKTNSTANRPLSVTWAPPETTTSPPDHATQILITSDQFQHHPNNFSSHDNTNHVSAKPYDHYFHENLLLSPDEEATNRSILDPTAMFFNLTGEPCKNSDVEVAQHHGEDEFRKNQMNSSTMWEKMGFPFSLPWDSPPCPTEISSSTYSTNKCYI